MLLLNASALGVAAALLRGAPDAALAEATAASGGSSTHGRAADRRARHPQAPLRLAPRRRIGRSSVPQRRPTTQAHATARGRLKPPKNAPRYAASSGSVRARTGARRAPFAIGRCRTNCPPQRRVLKRRKPRKCRAFEDAPKRTRTSTRLSRGPGPQPGASTNSAIGARGREYRAAPVPQPVLRIPAAMPLMARKLARASSSSSPLPAARDRRSSSTWSSDIGST